ncbi:MAG: HAD family hydrolase, partial [Candidatus Melainabacteria bacterium]|nr:HAD family hydrolase [Candidatus Melainabacteria bacterium]
VIAGGFSDGLAEIAQTTWADLRKASNVFVEHPVDTSIQYLKNHWQDAAAGAVISLVNPKGAATALLVGWSMRGLGQATIAAIKESTTPGADLTYVRSYLKDAVSHEGTAFLSAMPMAMAGSVVGRAGANAVFGHNMALYDLLAGKVRLEQVRANLWEIREAAMPPKVRAVITDLDQTTWGFYDSMMPAVRDVVPHIARKVGMSEEAVCKAIGQIMDARKTHEWPWVLEESKVARKFPGTPEEFRSQVVEPYFAAIDACRQRYLRAYPGVLDTLAELERRGIKVYALSDAPAFMVKARTQETGVAQYLDGMFAIETREPSVSAVGSTAALENGRARLANFLSSTSKLQRLTELPKRFEKPETGGILMIMQEESHLRPRQFLYIGDSRIKDGGVAQRVGIPFLYAKYGTYTAPEYEEIAAALRPEFSVGPQKPKVYPPAIAEAASYADILKHLEPKANYLALSKDAMKALVVPPRLQSALGYNLFSDVQKR